MPQAGAMAHDERNPLFSERVREQLLRQRILVLDGVLDDDHGTLLATQLLTLAAEDPAADVGLWTASRHRPRPGPHGTGGAGVRDRRSGARAAVGGRRRVRLLSRLIPHASRGEAEHDRAGCARGGRRDDARSATQILSHLLGQPSERDPQRSREGRDHLT